jgi:ribonuclease HI
MIINLFTDGGARGNPGPAGYGFVANDITDLPSNARVSEDAGIVLEKCGNYLGTQTNNQAEYEGLVAGIAWAHENYPDADLHIFMDSLLIVNQVKGVYRVKNVILAKYHRDIMTLLQDFPSYTIAHVRREYNTIADSLANMAMDQELH